MQQSSIRWFAFIGLIALTCAAYGDETAWGPNLIPNAAFHLRRDKPTGWKVSAKSAGKEPAVEFPAQEKGRHAVTIHPARAGNITLTRTLPLDPQATDKVQLRATLHVTPASPPSGAELYLRIRQSSDGKFIEDACRIWCVVKDGKLRIVQWNNGRPDTAKVIEHADGQAIEVASTGSLTAVKGYRQILIAAWPQKHDPAQGGGVFTIDQLSLQKKMAPALSLENVPASFMKSNGSLAFSANVSADTDIQKDRPLKLTVELARYRGDTLLFQKSSEYSMDRHAQRVTVLVNSLPAGDYRLTVQLYDSNHARIGKVVKTIQLIDGPFTHED